MKNKISFLAISVIALALSITACKKDKDADVTPANPCKASQIKGTNDQVLYTNEFTNGKVTKITNNLTQEYTTYDYDSGSYVKTSTFSNTGKLTGTSKIEVNENGYAGKKFSVEYGDDSAIIDTVYYQYDGSGYLTREIVYTYVVNTSGEVLEKNSYVTSYVIKDGNVASSTYSKVGDSGFPLTSTYEYETSIDNKSGISLSGEPSEVVPTGKSTKNPVKKVTTPLEMSTDEITYSVDDKGNIIEVKTIHTTPLGSTESSSKISYVCQ